MKTSRNISGPFITGPDNYLPEKAKWWEVPTLILIFGIPIATGIYLGTSNNKEKEPNTNFELEQKIEQKYNQLYQHKLDSIKTYYLNK